MSPPEKTPTLEDVARLADVSTATVSRCLNFPTKVSEKTREKVMGAVDALGYMPHFGARAMAARRTFTIGAIIPTMDNTIFARGIQAFQEELQHLGYTLLVASSTYKPDLEADQVKSLVARGADGLLLIGAERDAETYDFLNRRGVPVLAAWAYDPLGAVSTIGFDNRAAMHDLTRAITKRGHRHIGVISGILAGNDRASGRLKGIRDGLSEAGIDPTNLPVFETQYSIDNGAEALAQLLATYPETTAVMCGNDVLAIGALQKARDLGLNVPDDISITGFDDIELARVAHPGLTTVHVPHKEMGALAAQRLVDLIEGKGTRFDTRLDAPVVFRASLGPACPLP